jgi:hypothetical protein
MIRPAHERTRWLIVALFAVAMAWFESATVYYLRVLVDRVQPYQLVPLPVHGALGPVELVREAATLVMLLAVGMLAGRSWRTKIGYAVVAFGVWDVFYYVFLRLMSGWPSSVLDWDILFLLPLPWWGPVLAPVSIALLMIAWGTIVTQLDDRHPALAIPPHPWVACWLGIVLALYVFMADALRVLDQGPDAVRLVLPTAFNWRLFAVSLIMMSAPLAHAGWRMRAGSRRDFRRPTRPTGRIVVPQ